MFKKLREPWKPGRGKSIFTGIIFGLICLTFVFVGITPGDNGYGGAGTAATVNDVVISVADFQERVAMVENQYSGAFKDLPAAERQKRSKKLRESALEELVSYELVYQSAERVGVLPTVAATRDLIVSIPAFQEDGRFARQRYDQYLNYKGIAAADFENKVKRDVVVGQIREMFLTALRPPEIVQNLDNIIRDTKFNIEFIKIDEKSLQKAADEVFVLSNYLTQQENKAKIQSYYDSHKGQYTSQVEIRARHILIKGDSEATLKKIKEIHKEAETGDFAKLAMKYSEDEGTKSKGGDLDYFAKGKMVPQFEEAAFSLPVGKLSNPVKTAYGYHLIKVEGRRGGEAQPLEKVEKEIAKQLFTEKLKEESIKELTDLLKNKKDISSWTSKYKMKWEETGEFSAGQSIMPKIDIGEEAMQAAIQLKTKGEIYPDILRAGSMSYVLRLKNKKLPEIKSASQVAEAAATVPYSVDGAEVLSLWAGELKKSALIHRNQALLN